MNLPVLRTHRLQANYVSGQQGPWLVTSWLSSVTTAQRALLIIPPFAEEMNCCRRLFAALGRNLSAAGFDTYLPDFYGTGDSHGEFASIDIDVWRRDLVAWLPELSRYQQVHLLGCRFGAGLVQAWWPELTQHIRCPQILLWQPQLQANRFWQHLKRQQQLSSGLVSDDNSLLMQAAGYSIPKSLQQQLHGFADAWTLEVPTLWLEATVTGVPSAAVVKACNDNTRLQGLLCEQPYWLSQEPTDCTDLLASSWQFFTNCPPIRVAAD